MRTLFLPFALSVMIVLTGCSGIPSVSKRMSSTDTKAALAGFDRTAVKTDAFTLVSYSKDISIKADTLVVYIEGDGHAWKNSQNPSDNPTPISPIALTLAIKDPRPAITYLARPCQYVDTNASGCSQSLWTNARFSEQVIANMNQAVGILKERHQSKNLILVGYSGGGAVAALIAARRSDIKQLITVAGNLDTDAWVSYHQLEPLTGSLNPANHVEQLRLIDQVVFVGGQDNVIPPEVTQGYMQRYKLYYLNQQPRLISIKDYDHVCCWQASWPSLLIQAQ